jgi:serine protease Do
MMADWMRRMSGWLACCHARCGRTIAAAIFLRNMRVGMCALVIVVIVPHVLDAALPVAAGDMDSQEEAAIKAAVDRVAPAVVRIETVGGLDQIGQVLFGAGPTTGLVIDPAGYIVSSVFGFANKPASILARWSGELRRPARLVATDHSRMLVLLKVEAEKPLPYVLLGRSANQGPETEGRSAMVSEGVARRDMRVGQWAIAVGRTFESDRTNMAVGIVSALDRIWGKAIQTDAAVSPNNYGGPLIDIRGRVLGVLVPLSSESADEMAGVEWYDSGIGFAVPLEHLLKALPRLKNGEDLHPGLAGFKLKGLSIYVGQPIIASCSPDGPAARAGLLPDDRIVEIDGRPIDRAADVMREIGRRYAGEKMRVTVLRGGDRIQRTLELTARPRINEK